MDITAYRNHFNATLKIISSTQPTTKKVETAIKDVCEFNPDLLTRSNLGDAYNFSEVVPIAKKIQAIYKKINSLNFSSLPTHVLESLIVFSKDLLSLYIGIFDFDPTAPDSINAKKSLVGKLQRLEMNSYSIFSPHIAYLTTVSIGLEGFKKDFEEAKEKSESELEHIATIKQKAENAYTAISQATIKTGIAIESNYFDIEAKTHEQAAARWKIALWLYAAALLIWIFAGTLYHQKILLFVGSSASGIEWWIEIGLAKIMGAVVLVYLLLNANKNFMAHQHNAIVNRHRHNAILTYKAFVESAGSMRDVVLYLAADCIYSPQPTAFSKEQADKIPKPIGDLISKVSASAANNVVK